MRKPWSCLTALLLASIFALALGCGGAKQAMAPVAPSDTPLVETAAPMTAQPTLAPSPVPKITDEWYLERCNALAGYVRSYGNCRDEAEVQARVQGMAIDPDKKMVAFTFDDGPRDGVTNAILDIVEQYGIRVTFFIKGAYIDGHEQELLRMLSLGCEIGNHTWNHDNVEELSADEMRQTIGSVNERMEELFGYKMHLFRPPFIKYGDKGSDTRKALVALMQEWDMAIINHTRSTHDTYDDYTAELIYQRGVEESDELGHGLNKSIILCHDKEQKTVDAFGRIVPELLERGYQFVTVSELLHCSEEGFHAGWIYSKAD